MNFREIMQILHSILFVIRCITLVEYSFTGDAGNKENELFKDEKPDNELLKAARPFLTCMYIILFICICLCYTHHF
jgi:hypothetical protein